MSSSKQLLVFVVFCHRTRELTFNTALESVNAIRKSSPEFDVGYIFIDDGSCDTITTRWIEKSISLLRQEPNVMISEMLVHEHRLGLSSSLQSTIEYLDEIGLENLVWITQIPGNDQLSEDSLASFLSYPLNQELRILWRDNPRARPILKRTASSVLQLLVRFFLFPDIRQVTANYIAPLNHYKRWLNPKSGHAYGLWLIAGAQIDNVPVSQSGFSLKIRSRNGHEAVRKVPNLDQIFHVLFQLVKVKIFLKKNL